MENESGCRPSSLNHVEPDIDLVRLQITSAFLLVNRHWRATIQLVVSRYGLSAACATPLLFIGRVGEGVRQIVLADHIGIESSSLVPLLDQLSIAGLVRREEDKHDRRAKTIWYTDRGKICSSQIELDLIRLRAEVLKEFSVAELEAAMRLFHAIERASVR